MGSSKTPTTYSPGQAAQAAIGTAGAGEMMSIANQPIEQYANLYTTEALGPDEMQAQQALANRAAYQGAQAQMDIQSRVDPQAYAQRQMRMDAANKRLGELTGLDPNSYTYRAPSAYAMPSTSTAPPLSNLRAASDAIASNLRLAAVNKAGGDPSLLGARAPQNVVNGGVPANSYF